MLTCVGFHSDDAENYYYNVMGWARAALELKGFLNRGRKRAIKQRTEKMSEKFSIFHFHVIFHGELPAYSPATETVPTLRNHKSYGWTSTVDTNHLTLNALRHLLLLTLLDSTLSLCSLPFSARFSSISWWYTLLSVFPSTSQTHQRRRRQRREMKFSLE